MNTEQKEWIEKRAEKIIRCLAHQRDLDEDKIFKEEKVLFWDICIAMRDAIEKYSVNQKSLLDRYIEAVVKS